MSLRSRLLLLAVSLVLTTGSLGLTGAANAAPRQVAPIKRIQALLMAREPMSERREMLEHHRELRALARRMRRSGKHQIVARGERNRPEIVDEDMRLGALRGTRAARPAGIRGVTSLATANVRCNDPSGDLLTPGFGSTVVEGQCETSIVRWNNYMVAAWNDGKGYDDGTYQTQGYATSVDGGITWIDHGTFPLPAAYASTWTWTSDPVLSVNPTTGAFYFAALGDDGSTSSAIGVIKGRFTGTAFAWGSPSVARTVDATSYFLDKEWITVEPTTGRVYLTCTLFTTTDEIDFQYADSSLTSWSTPLQVSATGENGYVQGSRPVAGPGGNVYVVYYLIGPVDADYYRIARSTNSGVSFYAPADAASFYSNFDTGAPGFNRAQGIQFPSVAIDRSGGPYNGRLYLAWNESLNWFDDFVGLGIGTNVSEVESNNTPATATPATIGQTIRGTISTTADLDYYSIHLDAGQGLLVECDSLASTFSYNGTGLQDLAVRLFAPDGTTRLCYMTVDTYFIGASSGPTFLYVAPIAGTYYIRAATNGPLGRYRLRTGAASRTIERGRDQRDVFASWSDDGTMWSTPVRVSNSPVGYDDWLPEVAVGPNGAAYCAWYDWRDATASTAGGESSTYLASSSDAGATWSVLGAISDTRTAWSSVLTNIIPNQGDYISLFADTTGVVAAWSDGRAGNPDVYMGTWSTGVAPTPPTVLPGLALAGAWPNPATPSGVISFTLHSSSPATLTLYDLGGRAVQSREVGALGSGDHKVPIADGARLRAGVYFVRLVQDGSSVSRRIVLF